MASKQEMLEAEVDFYDPHPGLAGALVPLPTAMQNVAYELDGKRMTVREALEIAGSEAKKLGGTVDVVFGHRMITFEYSTGSFAHGYRLIRFKYPTLWW